MTKFDISESLLRKFAKLIEEAGLTEIEFEEEGRRLRLTKQAPAQIVAAPAMTQDFAAAPVASAPAAVATPGPTATAPKAIDGFVVEAAMVGTAYAAAEPGKPPFIAVGDRVSQGQTLLIIEAMKFMNQVPCPKAGVVKEILFKDGDPIEYGQPLVVLGD